MMKPNLKHAFEIIHNIEQKGGRAHIVGGAVRDSFLDRPLGDIDLASSFSPDQVMQAFDKVIPVGAEHGTVIIRYKGVSYEITTYRSETAYADYRHPDQVEFIDSIEDDLARRDFTINAMAFNSAAELIDPYGGKMDLERKIIRAVGVPEERFEEDPLRILRALRFASQLRFNLDNPLVQAIRVCAPLLRHISVERKAVEFEKLLAGEGYKRILPLCLSLKIGSFLPMFNKELSLLKKLPACNLKNMAEVITFYLMQGSAYTVHDWVKEWKLSNRVKLEALHLYDAVKAFSFETEDYDWILYQLPAHLQVHLINVAKALDCKIDGKQLALRYEKLPIKSKKELSFQAEDLIQAFPGSEKGRWIGDSLQRIEKAVVLKKIANEYQVIKEWVHSWNRQETDS
ncbi:CCA tRNA nucleotidyltransferase [Halobacillus sp. A1]|uniref:CCA tRNA nucleotidyltransferase n=1 Tax=Halobacillus sp. A1 TaxID=2880262 RepID=UPI0020A6AB75|nr:CCA tRNA nucleotidyltransferase [Halobacillus sp. A1]MCP3030716.1 CCA tRNA nucleotidyltransferase [Halobacillus sp. A1]